jgi:phospholipid transport system substrate-binding protein
VKKMKKLLLAALWLLASLIAPVSSASATVAPDVLVRQVTDEVLTIVRADKAIQAGDPRRVSRLVEEKILPHFDFRRMTMLAVGRDWRQASPQQQDRLVAAFTDLLVRTYSNAITQYRNQTIDVKPLRVGESDSRVQVRTEVRQAGAQPVTIDYVLERNADSWKVFDVAVAGVSLVTNYRSSFADEIRAGGIDGLIRSLETKNRDVTAGAARS